MCRRLYAVGYMLKLDVHKRKVGAERKLHVHVAERKQM